MFHGLLDIDKSPLLNLAKVSSKKATLLTLLALTTVSLSTGVVPINVAGLTNTETATAGVDIGANDIISNYWRRYESGRWQQTYFGTLGPSYSATLIRERGSSASARAHYICTNYVISKTGINIWDSAWFFVAVQYNGDRFNCYYRKRV